MNTIYTNQDFWKIESYYDESPGNISEAYIKYISPSSVSGEFSAINDTVNKLFYHIGELEEFLEAGKWTIWNYAIMEDGRIAVGDKWSFTVKEQIPSVTGGNCITGNCY